MSRLHETSTSRQSSAIQKANELIEEVYPNLRATVRRTFDIQESPDQSVQRQDLLHEAIEDFIEYVMDHPEQAWLDKLNKDYVFSSIIENFKQLLYNETDRGQVRAKYEDALKAAYTQREEAEAERMAERLDVEDLKQQLDAPVAQILETIIDTYEREHGEGRDIVRTLQKKFGFSVRKCYQAINFIRNEAQAHGFDNETIQAHTQ